MALKDRILNDIERCYMRQDHFAETHYWNGSEIVGVTDDEEALKRCRGLEVLAVSEIAGSCVICSRNGRQVFVTGHAEYDRDTLAKEYFRDKNKGLNPNVPYNYFPNDNPEEKPLLQWRSHSNNLYSNWLNYYVYQATPYEL